MTALCYGEARHICHSRQWRPWIGNHRAPAKMLSCVPKGLSREAMVACPPLHASLQLRCFDLERATVLS